jgi:hypothetical protein
VVVKGGDGTASSITGSSVTYAGGGGGITDSIRRFNWYCWYRWMEVMRAGGVKYSN